MYADREQTEYTMVSISSDVVLKPNTRGYNTDLYARARGARYKLVSAFVTRIKKSWFSRYFCISFIDLLLQQ